jgi:regulator of cell morphogenesis and NO signaling
MEQTTTKEHVMISGNLHSLTIKDIVKQEHRAAAIFEKYSLDFCCGGGKTIQAACGEKGLDPSRVLGDLEPLVTSATQDSPPFAEWPLSLLIDYIVNTHHSYVSKIVPVLSAHTKKVAEVHGANHPEVREIAELFDRVARELLAHMRKEELVLFPYIRRLADFAREGTPISAPPFGSLQNPIGMMEAEHQAAGSMLSAIRSLSNEYTPPGDACMTYQVTYHELQDFELDLHQHVHLENNILFPAALQMEQECVVPQ